MHRTPKDKSEARMLLTSYRLDRTGHALPFLRRVTAKEGTQQRPSVSRAPSRCRLHLSTVFTMTKGRLRHNGCRPLLVLVAC